MEFNQDNKIVQLCAKGMELEGQGELQKASAIFGEAWNEAANDFEKFIAAHYVARHQESISDKLVWDKIALKHSLNIDDETMKDSLASLYLNIGKCYEDLDDFDSAEENYRLALSYTPFLPEDGYGNMMKNGINTALSRVRR